MNPPLASCPSMPRRRTLLQIWFGLFFTFVAVANGNLESVDSAMTMHAARALLLRSDSGLRPSAHGAESLAEGLIADEIVSHEAEPVPRYGKRGKNSELRYVWFPMGHVWLLVPCVALGEVLNRAFPEIEARYREAAGDNYVFGMFVFDQMLVALLLPAASGATIFLLLLLIALLFGCTRREAALVAVAVLFGSQCFAFARETLSDGPGMACLLGALYAVVCVHQGSDRRITLLLGGVAAGMAALTRYPHALMVPPLALAVLFALWRRSRPFAVVFFVLGGLPFLVLLCSVNYARHGSIADTGYPPFASWFNYPIWFGATKLCIAAGKGILWLSPMLWLALPQAARRAVPMQLRWLAWVLFAIPIVLFGQTNGWQSGQCWGARYVTPSVVMLLALALPQGKPFRLWPRTFRCLLCLGIALSVTSVIAPTRGVQQLAAQGVEAMYAQRLADGTISEADFKSVQDDTADHFSFQPRFSPVHANWSYAWRSLTGGFEDDNGKPRNGAQFTIEPLFGITSTKADYTKAPDRWEDRGFRHLWCRFFGALLGVPFWWLLLIPMVPGLALLWAAHRGLSKN